MKIKIRNKEHDMTVNLGFFINKLLRFINRPALRNCQIDKTAKVGTGSNCIGVIMGRYSYMGKNNSVFNVSIGQFCSIASYCAIGGGEHKIASISTSPMFEPGRNILGKTFVEEGMQYSPQAVQIGNDVWIGEKTFIKAGISIGDGAIIGAHSVVTHDVPAYAIVAGAPAKLIRYRFNEEDRRTLLESGWWDWSENDLKRNSTLFNDPTQFLQALKENN